MSPRPYILAETNWKHIREEKFQVVILPWGATEAHNYHLPYSTDVMQCDYIAAESARKAWEKGAKIVVLPTVPFGVNTGQMNVPLDINMNPSTQFYVLKDIIQGLSNHKIPKFVILNGHGGNDFSQMIRELQVIFPGVFLSTMNWYMAIDQMKYFNEPGDHAGEMETSVMMHIAPDLTLPLSEAGDGAEKKFRIEALRSGRAWAQRDWEQITRDTGVGNPAASSAEKGQVFLEAVTDYISSFILDLDKADIKDLYE